MLIQASIDCNNRQYIAKGLISHLRALEEEELAHDWSLVECVARRGCEKLAGGLHSYH